MKFVLFLHSCTVSLLLYCVKEHKNINEQLIPVFKMSACLFVSGRQSFVLNIHQLTLAACTYLCISKYSFFVYKRKELLSGIKVKVSLLRWLKDMESLMRR